MRCRARDDEDAVAEAVEEGRLHMEDTEPSESMTALMWCVWWMVSRYKQWYGGGGWQAATHITSSSLQDSTFARMRITLRCADLVVMRTCLNDIRAMSAVLETCSITLAPISRKVIDRS